MRRSLNFKVIILLILIVFIGLGWSIKAAKNNLHQYAYYYASHMERRKHDYPVIQMTKFIKFNSELLSGYEIFDNFKDDDTLNYETYFIKRNVINPGDIVVIGYGGDDIRYYKNSKKFKNYDNKDTDELDSDSAWRNVTPVFNKKLSPAKKFCIKC